MLNLCNLFEGAEYEYGVWKLYQISHLLSENFNKYIAFNRINMVPVLSI